MQNCRVNQGTNSSPDQRRRLDDIGFIWDGVVENWEAGFSKLVQFKEQEGHCRVTAKYQIDGFKLGMWVVSQRSRMDGLSPDQRRRLDDIGFIWDPFGKQWEEGFSKLVQFKEQEGHCRVPQAFKLNGFGLGVWLHRQRRTKDSMSPERKQRLHDIGFIWTPSKDKT